MIDAHTHLTMDVFRDKRMEILSDFVSMGWTWLVSIWMDTVANNRVLQLCNNAEEADIPCIVKSTIGRHPYEVVNGTIKENNFMLSIQALDLLLQNHENHIVAIGECGVDLHYDNGKETLLAQQQLFALQCQLALQRWLPVVIHSRDAFEETCIVLQDFPGLDIYFHCRWYWPEQVEKVQEWFPGSYIWYCGNVTYKNATQLRDSLKITPQDSLLLETDAPYLAPQAVRWQTNSPLYISHLYDFVAEELDKDKTSLINEVTKNFLWFYHL